MLTPRGVLTVSALLMVAAAGACGDEPDPVPSPTLLPEGGTGMPDAMVGECAANSSNSCTCPGVDGGAALTGTQSCYNGTWLQCACSNPPPVTSVAGECLPGQYSGSFKGDYRSGFAVFGLFSIPVEALDFSGSSTGLSFTLNEASSGGGATEFATYSISNGYVKGTANGVFPFEGILTGDLDCATKKFTGSLEGCYALGVDLFDANVGRFKGPVVGNYDVKTHTFTMGTWDVKEMNMSLGGSGSWNTAYKGPAPANQMPPGAPACNVRPGGSDAGTSTPDASAPDASI